MIPADLDAAAAAVLAFLLTYAMHSTILLAGAAIAAWRFADHHAWLDPIWKAALVAPLVTASVQLNPIALPLTARVAPPAAATAGEGPRIARAPSVDKPQAPGPKPEAPSPRPLMPAVKAAATEVVAPPAIDHIAENHDTVPMAESRSSLWVAAVSRWPLIAAITWLIVASVSVLRYAVRLRRVHRALGAGSPEAAPALVDTIDELRGAASEPRAIRVATSALCRVPLALSGRRIVVPLRFHDELDAEQQRAALAHELAHVVRRDPEWRIAAEVIERALFFQPLNRFARSRLSDSAEFLCDEWAVRHTHAPLALARCLSVVASWWTPADSVPAGASAMARSDSAMVRRVTRILEAPGRITPLRVYWLAIPVAIVAVAVPRVTATPLPATSDVSPAAAAVLSAIDVKNVAEPREATSEWSAAEIAAAQAQRRVYRFDQAGVSLEERWRRALADAGKQGFGDFWIVYTFNTPTHADDLVLSDSLDGNVISSNGRLVTEGPPLAELVNPPAVLLEGGKLAVLLHYRGTRPDGIDRAGYRSIQLGFDFGRTPVFWLGDAPESESFTRVQALFGLSKDRKIQTRLIDLASRHSNSDAVIPFLARLVEPSWPPEIRNEAAEGFEYHPDPRSVEILLRVARTDADSEVRAEAAETIGEVQTPQSIPALLDLVSESTDPDVRREAAEAFGSQPAARALPALEKVIATTPHEDVLNEAIEAIGELGDPAALPLLQQIADTHPNQEAQKEAVETLGDLDAPGVVDALTRIVWQHRDVAIQREAVETLGDRRDDAGAMAALERVAREHEREEVQAEAVETITDGDEHALHPLVLELAVSGRSARLRREALESIGDAVEKIADAQLLDRAQAVVERAIFDDPDQSVRLEALDALDEFPNDRALRTLRDVIARHPDARIRREAEEQVRERQ